MQHPATTLLNKKGTHPFPCLKDLHQLYSKKGIRTVFLSIGASSSCMADLEIAESIGCPINVICANSEASKAWFEVKGCLRTRKAAAEPISDFSLGAETIWVLPKNVNICSELVPGTICDVIESVCKSMRLSDDDRRVDILKVDLEGAAGRLALYEILDAGFRPATILIRWSATPDSSPPIKIAAGNLHNCGYALVGAEGQQYLYYFVDNDMYATCSWEKVGAVNPMVDGIVTEVLEQIKEEPEPEAEEHVFSAMRTLISDMGHLINSVAAPLTSTLAIAKALGLPEPPNNRYTHPLFYTWISKMFDKLDAMNLPDELRMVRKEIIVALKGVEASLDEAKSPRVVDVSVSTTTDAC